MAHKVASHRCADIGLCIPHPKPFGIYGVACSRALPY